MEPEIAKLLAGVGAILAAVGPFEHVVGIVGVVLLLVGLISLADFYGDQPMKSDAIYWFVFAFIALIVWAIGAGAGLFSLGTLLSGHFVMGIVWMIGFIIVIVIAWIFWLLSARRFRNVMSSMAKRSGENLFETAGALYFWGAALTIILVGGILLIIAFILAGVAFLTMKTSRGTP